MINTFTWKSSRFSYTEESVRQLAWQSFSQLYLWQLGDVQPTVSRRFASSLEYRQGRKSLIDSVEKAKTFIIQGLYEAATLFLSSRPNFSLFVRKAMWKIQSVSCFLLQSQWGPVNMANKNLERILKNVPNSCSKINNRRKVESFAAFKALIALPALVCCH